MKKLLLGIFILLIFNTLFAQEIYNVPAADKKTYNQYLKKDWKGLIKSGKKYLKKDIDFYFLRYRMGIAYYEQKKYAKAVKHFEKIHSENSKDPVINEYLYYSYLLSGKTGDARLLASSFNRELKEKLNIETEYPFIRALYFSTIQNINENYEYLPQAGELVDQKTVLNESWYNLSLEHFVGKRVTIFHGYSRLKIVNKVRSSNSDYPSVFTENTDQNEYYFSMKYHIGKGTNITGGFHYLNSLYYVPVYIQIGRRTSLSYLYYFRKNSIAGSLKIDKSFSIFNTSLESSVSNLNEKLQIQPAVALRIYPFSDTRFYSETKGIYQIEDDGITKRYSPVFKQTFGINFLKYSSLNTSVTYGDLLNYTTYNAFIANNDLDKTTLSADIYLNLGLAKGRFNIFLNYQYNQKENAFDINDTKQTKDYTNQIIAGGIKWYFKKY